ncbi:MAG TPA: acyltransferase [Candidatus Baltobacteraceae bacterium]|nr:acyltransferase [Candidatus Baltobacteraceae bacterium]
MKDRLGVLDGLRGIAVLLVLWYHVWEISWLPAPWSQYFQFIPETGFIGVPLFFFLSGFVITYPFLRAQAHGQPLPTWGHFAWRRFIKIVPSYVLSIAVAYAIGYAVTQRTGAAPWQEILSHLLFVHTWWQATYGSINGVLWTLAVEVEFYCIFPLVWWCFRRAPWATAIGMTAVALAWRTWLQTCCYSGVFPQYAENLPGYLDIFASGMLAAYVFTRIGARARASRWNWLAPLVALAGIVMAAALLKNLYDFRNVDQWQVVWQVRWRPLFGIAFGTIAVASLCAPRWWELLLANAPLRFLAIISYNLYLYHQMIAREMLAWHIPSYHGDPHADAVWQMKYTILALAATIVEAALVTYFVERPLLRLKEPRLTKRIAGHSTTM